MYVLPSAAAAAAAACCSTDFTKNTINGTKLNSSHGG
jgi:hypothetical protein